MPRTRCNCRGARETPPEGSANSFRCSRERPWPPGVAGLFMETHPDPAKALSDGPNAWPLDRMGSLLTTLVELDLAVKKKPFEESLL